MLINTSQIEMVLMNKAIPANLLENATGINRSTITRVRNGERKIENLTLETIAKIQEWIDAGNYRFSYDYSELIEELEADIEEGLTGEYIYIVRGEYNEIMGKSMIIDYYYTPEEIEEGDIAEKVLTASVLAEMKADNEIF
nr:MAG TPA: LacI-type transcriptional regulator [Caudoviricetes sp.]